MCYRVQQALGAPSTRGTIPEKQKGTKVPAAAADHVAFIITVVQKRGGDGGDARSAEAVGAQGQAGGGGGTRRKTRRRMSGTG